MREGPGGLIRRIVRWFARILMRARGVANTKIHGVPFRVDPYHISFWHATAHGRWEPEVLESLDRFLNRDSVYLDVGAYIGPTVLFAARKCKKVYCFEPDPDAYEYLAWNLRLNRLRNVVPFCMALTSASAIRSMASPDGMLGTSKTSLLVESEALERIEVPCIGWSEWQRLFAPPRIDVIKVDIEGGEFDLLPAMAPFLRANRPPLLLSIHGTFLPTDVREARIDELLGAVAHYSVCRDEQGRKLGAPEARSIALQRLCQLVFSDEQP